jgi:four helix bundle protein
LELETQITIGQELGYVELEDGKRLINLAAEVGRMLNGMVNTFQTLINSEPQPKT